MVSRIHPASLRFTPWVVYRAFVLALSQLADCHRDWLSLTRFAFQEKDSKITVGILLVGFEPTKSRRPKRCDHQLDHSGAVGTGIDTVVLYLVYSYQHQLVIQSFSTVCDYYFNNNGCSGVVYFVFSCSCVWTSLSSAGPLQRTFPACWRYRRSGITDRPGTVAPDNSPAHALDLIDGVLGLAFPSLIDGRRFLLPHTI